MKEEYIFLGDLKTPDSNLLFFHSSLKILNILVLLKINKKIKINFIFLKKNN